VNRVVLVIFALALVVSACGDDAATTTTTTQAGVPSTQTGATTTAATNTTAAAGGPGGCTVMVTGDLETSWTGPDGMSAFTSDYWYTEDELRSQWGFIGDPNIPFDTAFASGQQIVSLFLGNCAGPSSELVSMFASVTATSESLPFGPGEYILVAGLFAAEEQPGNQLTTLLSMDKDTVWVQEGEGTLTITAWDHHHVQGTFTLNAVERFSDTDRHATVTGSFDFTCTASVSCS